jgi:hypothetical protein
LAAANSNKIQQWRRGLFQPVQNPAATFANDDLVVLVLQGDQVVLGQGGEGIKEGSHYKVFRYGERIVDPYNGEFLGREEIYCAEIEVERVLPKQA